MKSWIYKNIFLKVLRPAFHRLGFDLVVYDPPVDKRVVFNWVSPVLKKIESWVPEKEPSPGEHIIWQFWWQGKDNAPPLVKRCLESVRCHANGWNVVVIDEQNVSQYVDVPAFIDEKHRKGMISHTHFSDYLRVKLLQRHGGIWIDATVFLTGEIPADILNAKIFAFKTSLWASVNDIPDRQTFLGVVSTANKARIGGGECACSSWLISSYRNSSLMDVAALALEWYWQNAETLVDYFLFHFFISYAVAANEFCRKEFIEMPTRINVKPHMLLFKLFERFDAEQWKLVREASTIHKLSYKGNDLYDTAGTFLDALLTGRLTEV